jgi:superfamily II RNA helicase
MSAGSSAKTLLSAIPSGGETDPDSLLEIFLDWVAGKGIELYPAQEEAILEVFAGNHLILNTPTGSGKSLVAVAVHLFALATQRRSFYTSPIKALVSEKFFELCAEFGADNVGLLTGDASINHDAPIICCTAEVLASMALTEGDAAKVDFVVMDEFHYYADRQRGVAWQIPLLLLERTTFTLMSATLGDMTAMSDHLEKRTSRKVSLVSSVERPVPLDFSYSKTPLVDAIQSFIVNDRAPVYVVNFTQRDCAELAQGLTSINFCSKEDKARIAKALKGTEFDTPYGKDISKYVRHGLGIHHGGLLPKYRFLVERLTQQGLLKVICGTDTLGVGINMPIRTVLFRQLCKYDGEKTKILSIRHFKQIAGRAGRKGHDDKGWVVAQAPPHAIENLKLKAKATAAGKKKFTGKKPPDRGYVHWDESTFNKLANDPPEELISRFRVDHGMLLAVLQRPSESLGRRGGYGDLLDLIDRSHDSKGRKTRLRKEARELFIALHKAGVIYLEPRASGRGKAVFVREDLQEDFSLHHSLALYVMEALETLDQATEDYPFKLVSLIESILEDPRVVLMAQQNVLRRQKLAELKAEGVEYDERQEILAKIGWPMPDAELIFSTFDRFASQHPWVSADDIRPKSVAREMFERYASFKEYVGEYGLQRVEGLLLRHLSQTYKAMLQCVPESARTDEVLEIIAFLRLTIQRTDSSLLKAWEKMGQQSSEDQPEVAEVEDIAADNKTFVARIRAELHSFVAALSRRDYEEALGLVTPKEEDPWTATGLEERMAEYHADYQRLRADHHARQPGFTQLEKAGDRQWKVQQILCDEKDDNMWYVEGVVDLRGQLQCEGPLIRLTEVGV